MKAEMEGPRKTGQSGGKKSISRTNASQQKRVMKWLFKHSAVISISAVQCFPKMYRNGHITVLSLNTPRYQVQQEENSGSLVRLHNSCCLKFRKLLQVRQDL